LSEVAIQPLTPERWPDLETLFGPNGASGGCWCMWWRWPRSRMEREKGAPARAAFLNRVADGPPPGLLAYADGRPVGWAQVTPATELAGLARSRILRPVDALPVWSLSCFFVTRTARRQRVSDRLIEAAKDFAAANGAPALEAYPIDDPARTVPFLFTGRASTFVRHGFVEVARRSPKRPILRATLA